MKRRLTVTFLMSVAVFVCVLFTACVPLPDKSDEKDKKLDSPTDIKFESVTQTTIEVFDVLYGEEGGGATEISINGSVWIDFDNSTTYVFEGLTPNTEYTVYARQKAYGKFQASDAFTQKVKTLRGSSDRVPENVTASIYHGTVTLNGLTDEMEVSYDGGKTYVSDKSYTFTEKGDKTVLVRYKENSEYLAGEDLQIKVAYNDFAGGSGTDLDPFLIETYEELRAINEYKYSAVYKLLNDITFPAVPVTDIIVFSGTLLGNGKKLVSPVIDYSQNSGINAFGGIFHTNGYDTKISDLTVENAQITTAGARTSHGILINCAQELVNCKVDGKIILSCVPSRSYNVGGLCGEINDANGKISGCSADVEIEVNGSDTSGFCFGGLVGKLSANCSIENSNANITASNGVVQFYNGYAGGLAGAVEQAQSVTVSRSYANVDFNLAAINCYVGGLVALSHNADVKDCYAIGKIAAGGRSVNPSSKCVAGGITAGAEDNTNTTGSVSNCYSAVNIAVDKDTANIVAAGIICNAKGTSAKKIENCLFTGSITVNGTADKTVDVYAIVCPESGYTVNNVYISHDSSANINVDENVGVVSVTEYLTSAWIKNTLGFDEAVWQVFSGRLPELKK